MKRTAVYLMIPVVCLWTASALAEGRGVEAMEKSHGKAVGLMPASLNPEMQKAVEIKKALDAADRDLAVKFIPGQIVRDVVHALNELKDRRNKKDKGDDADGHKKGSVRIPGVQKMLDLTDWNSSSTWVDPETNIVTTYYYATSTANPYDAVAVTYDGDTHKILSATAYTNDPVALNVDLSGKTLQTTMYRSDGSIFKEIYESEPNRYGTVVRVALTYDSYGNIYDASQTIIQPLNLKKVTLPTL